MYTWDGRSLGSTRLDRMLRTFVWISTIGGAGHYIAVPSEATVRNFKVVVDPACDLTATAAR